MASLILPANKNMKQVPGFVASMAILDTLPPSLKKTFKFNWLVEIHIHVWQLN